MSQANQANQASQASQASQATDFKSQKRVELPGSEREPFETAAGAETPEFVAAVAAESKEQPAEPVTVTVLVPRKQRIDTASLGSGEHLTHEEFAVKHGPNEASLSLVEAFAKEFGLAVTKPKEPGRRSLQLTGSEAQMEAAFGVKLREGTQGGKRLRVREGAICLPEGLIGHVDAVLGLDNRPQAKAHFRRLDKIQAHAASVSYTPVQVAQLYGFPAKGSAQGQTIGIIELGGGFVPADIQAYFSGLGLTVPNVVAVPVDGGTNTPDGPNGADGEVMLDIEVCAAVAPGARIAVYFAPNTDQGFTDAISTAVHDATNKPSVISISWGGPESSWTAQAMNALDGACQAAAVLGVTITVAAGDDGATDGVKGTAKHVDFPASSPHVIACGGTKLNGSGTTIASEVVWNELASKEGATGGGVSAMFALPSWQAGVGVPKPSGSTGGRGVPDVAGDADPATGYTIRVDGQTAVIGGTSAVAPLWAGLVALANAANGKTAGFANPALYKAAKTAFHDITSGHNGVYCEQRVLRGGGVGCVYGAGESEGSGGDRGAEELEESDPVQTFLQARARLCKALAGTAEQAANEARVDIKDFPQRLKPPSKVNIYGGTEVPPLQNCDLGREAGPSLRSGWPERTDSNNKQPQIPFSTPASKLAGDPGSGMTTKG